MIHFGIDLGIMENPEKILDRAKDHSMYFVTTQKSLIQGDCITVFQL